ncbi:hypothetical protein PIROE2DRAFT_3864 [Piromyces sp. E2]|nr:hypothetical protein PIROE2DRAFT_3864 [Piromyces sp. E2]|eukprot:OUM68419.1 hypothetical protein PIROE2DRAFT_3864 [Piromyces sp. E2]
MGCDCPDVLSDFNLVGYGYLRFGKGKYWKTLLVASCTGLTGAVLEKVCVVWTDHPINSNATNIYILLLFNEPFWIITEFAIPYLNMIKLNAILDKNRQQTLKIFTLIAFILFSIFRFRIGYLRFSSHAVFNEEIFHAHGLSFSTMAITEFVFSVCIINKMTKDVKMARIRGTDENIYEKSRKSSLTILLLIDICGIILAILSMFSNDTLEKVLKPFHCLKSNSILILAFDSIILKLDAKSHGYKTTNSYNNNSMTVDASVTNFIKTINNGYNNNLNNNNGTSSKKDQQKNDTEKEENLNEHQLNNIPNLAYLPNYIPTSSPNSIPLTTFSNNKSNGIIYNSNLQSSKEDYTKYRYAR